MEKILCITDFTNYARNALLYTQELALSLQAKTLLFHSVPLPEKEAYAPVGGVPYMEPIPDLAEKKVREQQISLAQEKLFSLAKEFNVFESELRVGTVTTTLPQVAAEADADLLVLGHEGMLDISPTSLTSQIIRNSPCPVLIIPPHVAFRPLEKIVFATDLRGDAFTDVAFVLQLATAFKAQVSFLHVLPEAGPEEQAAAERGLKLLCKRSNYPHVSYALEKDNSIQEGINRFCFQETADVLVMGSRNMNFWQYLFLENKALKVASHAFLPVLVLPYKK
jgi:nucleotide-binding universal stress UspA family protein